ncbi:hypothetical protein FA15DRAFT_659145 [Coprinopsis marcescibilis]|uniref:Phosphoribosyltransferase domain-containing protein n=1 Tax=Coprinopsis marcescibilis TaxID=230819 RepID=A0A5C3KKE2_COPMA|nr:hypothetical protein FA15DRAFT_659145 [Coprinopsis marcescibilis]
MRLLGDIRNPEPDPTRFLNFVVAGQSGIGKSFGLFVILVELIAAQERVAFQDKYMYQKELFHYYSKSGYQLLTSEDDYMEAVSSDTSSRIYHLVDTGGAPITSSAVLPHQRDVYVCTPARNNWSHIFNCENLTTRMCYMGNQNADTVGVVKLPDTLLLGFDTTALVDVFNKLPPFHRLQALYTLFGGSARRCFQPTTSDHATITALQSIIFRLSNAPGALNKRGLPRSPALTALWTPHKPLPTLLQFLPLGLSAKPPRCHPLHVLDLHRKGPELRGLVALAINLDFTKTKTFKTCSSIPIDIPDVYNIPEAIDFPGIDSCSIIDGELFLFQITVNSTEHEFNSNCIAKLTRPLLKTGRGDRKVHVVFIQPMGNGFAHRQGCTGTETTQKIAEKYPQCEKGQKIGRHPVQNTRQNGFGKRVLVLDDVMTSGKAVPGSIETVRQHGGEVVGFIQVLNRDEAARCEQHGQGD